MINIKQIKVEVTKNSEETIKKCIAKKINIPIYDIENYDIIKKSIDARNKDEIYYVYEVDVSVKNEEKVLKKNQGKLTLSVSRKYQIQNFGNKKLKNKPIIIGSGPAGLFAAYILAENGYHPIIIERGEPVEKRIQTVELFWEKGILNPNSNVQFGEGGAGTFSDGKLNTLVKDECNRGRKVFETFISCGAPSEIMYDYKPHIGTNVLRNVIKNLREKIITMGGEFRYNTCLTNIIYKNEELKKIELNHQEMVDCDVLVLAVGHSARDTFNMLYENKLNMQAKPFAVGIRVSHRQEMINISQYGLKYKDILPPASYKLTYQSSTGRGVYSFCMCPGGYVVNASSEEQLLVVNGMSNYERESENANSAIVVTITPDDFGTKPLDGVYFQRELEQKTFEIGKGKIPIQLLKDFKNNIVSNKIGSVNPIFKGEYTFANLNEILPKYINDSIKESFSFFGQKIKGFDQDDTILAGIESRTSSPVRMVRDEFYESNIKGIYPCGEGAGYAGGITSAAIDGIKVAEAIIEKYHFFE